MKALTICQPYPYLICLPETDPRHKRVENRTWATNYRGPLAVHAGKSQNWLTIEPGDDGKPWDANYEIPLASMEFGAVVATCNLIDCVSIEDVRRLTIHLKYPWLGTHRHASGPFCFVLADVKRLEKPIPFRGAQGFFEVPDELLTQICEKVKHVKRAGPTRDHTCHWPGCGEQCPPSMWGCRRHWFRLPKSLRDRIWATYKPGQEERGDPSAAYLKVADDVQKWIREHGSKS